MTLELTKGDKVKSTPKWAKNNRGWREVKSFTAVIVGYSRDMTCYRVKRDGFIDPITISPSFIEKA